tara:strand:- start:424 stop:654 length:231 start_codon:yes stop_codon:yes gene_type:complete
MSHTIFTGGAVDKLEEVLKELTKRIKVLEDSVTTIEECDISEWNTPAKDQFKRILKIKRQKAEELFEEMCREEAEK